MSTRQGHKAGAVADTKLTVLVDSAPGAAAVAKALPDNADRLAHIRVVGQCGPESAKAENLLVFSAASTLDQVAECVSVANKAHRLAALIVHTDVDANWLPYVFHHAGLRTLRNMIVHSDPELPTRILKAWAIGGEHDFIADAAVIKNRLVVRSCAFEEYSVAFDVFPALRAIPDSGRSSFVLEEEGLLLYWADFQVHLDLDDIRFANDPKRQQAARTARIGDQRAIGTALKRLREEAGLKQSDIEGISERQVRRVESGDRLTVDTLDSFARAMRVESEFLLERLGEMADDIESSGHQTAEIIGSPQRSKDVSENRNDAQVISYRRSSSVRHSERSVGETLQLAAESSADPRARGWDLRAGDKGSVHGVLEHDFRTDHLVFVIDEVRISSPEPLLLVIVASSSRLAEPLVSSPFFPSVSARVSVASGQGIVPRDVSSIELRIADAS